MTIWRGRTNATNVATCQLRLLPAQRLSGRRLTVQISGEVSPDLILEEWAVMWWVVSPAHPSRIPRYKQPIRGQYSGHLTSIDQWEAAILHTPPTVSQSVTLMPAEAGHWHLYPGSDHCDHHYPSAPRSLVTSDNGWETPCVSGPTADQSWPPLSWTQ